MSASEDEDCFSGTFHKTGETNEYKITTTDIATKELKTIIKKQHLCKQVYSG